MKSFRRYRKLRPPKPLPDPEYINTTEPYNYYTADIKYTNTTVSRVLRKPPGQGIYDIYSMGKWINTREYTQWLHLENITLVPKEDAILELL